MPQRAQDVPRSKGQQPKGKGKPSALLAHNLLDTAHADSKRELTRDR
jgi:hypothetical protein